MKKIKVVHHSKTVGYSGTDRTAQLFCKYLAQSERFEPFIVYREGPHENSRLEIVKEWLGEDHVIPYKWEPGENVPPYIPADNNLAKVLEKIEPDIVHIHRAGYAEWPGFKYMYPKAKWIETNIFGYNDTAPERQMDMSIYISQYIRDRALRAGNVDGPVLFNPIEQPVKDVLLDVQRECATELQTKYGIPRQVGDKRPVLLGRVGRADNFDPISLKAFAEVEKLYPHVFYIVINPCQQWIDKAKELGINNIRFGKPIVSDDILSSFYMGLDIYAHARHDGECCPCNIQEAMMHKVPVVSHESAIYNGQSEIIGNAGFVVPVGDWEAYRDVLVDLIENPVLANEEENGFVQLRDYFALEARRRAMRYFEAGCMTAQLAQIYDYVLAQ